jgi:DNA modification methylase
MTPRNTLLHGDCLTLLPQLAAESVAFVLTDPPYLTRYRARDGRTVPNDDNDAWLRPAFAGSSSTLLAARTLGRAWLGIELDAGYHAAACQRLGEP